jgi:hypothetical protein
VVYHQLSAEAEGFWRDEAAWALLLGALGGGAGDGPPGSGALGNDAPGAPGGGAPGSAPGGGASGAPGGAPGSALRGGAMRGAVRIVMTDDVHHVRIARTLGEGPGGAAGPGGEAGDADTAAQVAAQVAAWMRPAELSLYRAADVVATVAPEDAAHITSLLRSPPPAGGPPPPAGATLPASAPPRVVWVPFAPPAPLHPGGAAPPPLRPGGRSGLFFLGTPHAVAVHALVWFVSQGAPPARGRRQGARVQRVTRAARHPGARPSLSRARAR